MNNVLHTRIRRIIAAAAIGAVAALGVGLGGSAAHAVTGSTGTHYKSVATCDSHGSSAVTGSMDTITVKAPTIYAVNATSGFDSQIVSFRQRLVKWNGSAWVNTGSQSAVWSGPASDRSAARDFTDGQGHTYTMPSFTFNAGAGYYAIVTDYAWNQSAGMPSGSDMAFAVHSNNNPTAYCTFQY
ncbi:MAG TPA: hypothetical protein VMZ22_02265 [Acidimicrobiales bacterium]|nr:hypothetical protein [Acidimicrobiales bacterium]